MADDSLPRQTKICTKCEERKSIDEFYFIKALGSYLTQCKACLRIKQREYNRQPEEVSEIRKCISCGEEKVTSAFYARVKGGRLRNDCKDCAKADVLRRQSIHPQKRKTYAELVLDNPEGVRKRRRRSYVSRRSRFEGWININI